MGMECVNRNKWWRAVDPRPIATTGHTRYLSNSKLYTNLTHLCFVRYGVPPTRVFGVAE